MTASASTRKYLRCPQLDATCDALADASRPHPQLDVQRRELNRRLAECDRQLGRYREALAGNGDATEIAGWIVETQRERDQLRYDLASQAPTDELTRDEVCWGSATSRE